MPPATESQPAAAVTVISDKVASPEAKPTARLCHLVIRPDFVGYGFKLLEDTERKREFVDSVEPGSPAEAAGLRVKDVIIEVVLLQILQGACVNGAKVEGASHQDILDRIMSIPNETRLLVADGATCRWNRERGVADSDSLPSVVELSGAEAADQSASKPASRQAGASPASSTPSVAAQVADREVRQQSVERADPDRSGPDLPISTPDKKESSMSRQQEPHSLAESALRRGTAAEGTQPRSGGTEPQVAAQVADHEVRKKSVEHTDPDRSRPNLPSSTSNKDEPFMNSQQEPDSLAEGTLRRRTAAEGTQPKSDGSEHKVYS
ncbi:Na(+)/H(+) exchange regulatory cofactor NHE-RF1-like [Dermacentor silvarum]|uniref:Na(+)/H(+) exchange regulatory cofactor NHE-RF1-like n=1 Tax=Dermacentor silvarum TaxID=543639 RepID=UPI002100F533|nr:Na(+)/H(+) exchange regulatory cofactor NHE-RF1-like [Dermacentor silvarum]